MQYYTFVSIGSLMVMEKSSHHGAKDGPLLEMEQRQPACLQPIQPR